MFRLTRVLIYNYKQEIFASSGVNFLFFQMNASDVYPGCDKQYLLALISIMKLDRFQ